MDRFAFLINLPHISVRYGEVVPLGPNYLASYAAGVRAGLRNKHKNPNSNSGDQIPELAMNTNPFIILSYNHKYSQNMKVISTQTDLYFYISPDDCETKKTIQRKITFFICVVIYGHVLMFFCRELGPKLIGLNPVMLK